MDEHENREYMDMAYTAPAEGEPSFQFSSCMEVPPAAPAQKEKKPRKGRPLLTAVLILLAVGMAAGFILWRYTLNIHRTGGGFSVQIQKRGSTTADFSISEKDEFAGDGDKFNSAYRNRYQWDGATLDMTPGIRGGNVSFSQLYSACSPAVGCLCATDDSGNSSYGAVVVMTEDGALLTSTHIISGANSLRVTLNGQEYTAYIVGMDYATDLAVLKIDAEGLKTAEFSSGEEMQPGDWVAVVGNPVGQVVNIANGLLSAVNPDFRYRGFALEAMQVYMNLGDIASGSALVNSAGQVIGIVNMDMASQMEDSSGIGFAISMRSAKCVIDELLQNGYVAGRPSSGLTVSELPAAYTAYYQYPSCLYISSVKEDSTAWEAGIRRGDLILEANDVAVDCVNDLYTIINGMQAGDWLTLKVYRNREVADISFMLMEATGAD